MDRKLGAHAPVPMFRVVERVARGLHRLYLVSQKMSTLVDNFAVLFSGGVSFSHVTGLLRATGGRARSGYVQRTLEAG